MRTIADDSVQGKADADYLPVPAHPLEERERIPPEFHRVPKQSVPARHQPGIADPPMSGLCPRGDRPATLKA